MVSHHIGMMSCLMEMRLKAHHPSLDPLPAEQHWPRTETCLQDWMLPEQSWLSMSIRLSKEEFSACGFFFSVGTIALHTHTR
jgi:hypothetical protein